MQRTNRGMTECTPVIRQACENHGTVSGNTAREDSVNAPFGFDLLEKAVSAGSRSQVRAR